MSEHPVGSTWSVLGIENGLVVVLAGPFAASRGAPEYLVAPLYTGNEPGFVWTSEDVRLTPQETGLPEDVFAAIWNARPVLEADLVFRIRQLTPDATVAVRDAYWASLNERPLGKSPRLGRSIRSASDPAAEFQARELKRWQEISGRVFSTIPTLTASATFHIGDFWSLTMDDVTRLQQSIEESELILPPVELAAVGPNRALFSTKLFYPIEVVPPSQDQYFIFDSLIAHESSLLSVWQGSSVGLRFRIDARGSEQVEMSASNSQLALAA